jgi:hypothetical protein
MLELPRVELPSFTPPVLPVQNDTGVPTAAEEEEEKPAAPAQPAKVPPMPAVIVPAIEIPPPEPPSQESAVEVVPHGSSTASNRNNFNHNTRHKRIDVPVPTAEILSAAATTSVVSVGAALVGTSIFKQLVSLFKPVVNQLWKQIQKKRGKSTLTWARAKRLRKGRRQVTPDG